MKEIQLANGKGVVLVDDADFELVSPYRWALGSHGYATAYVKGSCRKVDGKYRTQQVLMHRLIAGAPKGKQVDHVNHNKLDNRRANLRLASSSENMMNRASNLRPGFSSKYRGVNHRGGKARSTTLRNDRGYEYAMSKPWAAFYKGKYAGIFETEREAALAYDFAAWQDLGRNAQLNFPMTITESGVVLKHVSEVA